jgi:hypothetical protein
MRPSALVLLALVALSGCGSNDSPTLPALSSPLPPVTTLLDGAYDLVVTPAEACGLPRAPYVIRVEARSLDGVGGKELRATLPGGDGSLVLEMLYVGPGQLQGSVSTLTWVAAGADELFVRASGSGQVTAASGGRRAEVQSGTMSGDVSVIVDGGGDRTCTSPEQRWSLVAR